MTELLNPPVSFAETIRSIIPLYKDYPPEVRDKAFSYIICAMFSKLPTGSRLILKDGVCVVKTKELEILNNRLFTRVNRIPKETTKDLKVEPIAPCDESENFLSVLLPINLKRKEQNAIVSSLARDLDTKPLSIEEALNIIERNEMGVGGIEPPTTAL